MLAGFALCGDCVSTWVLALEARPFFGAEHSTYYDNHFLAMVARF